MDKNTFTGLFLMMAVIFGFMWLNQPSEEELAASRAEAEKAAEVAQKKTTDVTITTIDSLSTADVALLRSTIAQYGEEITAADGSKVMALDAEGLHLELHGTDVKGTVGGKDFAQAVVSADVTERNQAVATVRSAINGYSKSGAFAKCLVGEKKVITLKNDSLKVDISTKGAAIERATLLKYTAFNDPDGVTLFTNETNHLGFVLNGEAQRFDTSDYYFTPEVVNDSTVVLALDLGAGAKWSVRYTLPRGSYMLRMEVEQKNMDKVIPANIANIDIYWTQKMGRHEEGKMFEERNSGVYYKLAGGKVDNLDESKNDDKNLQDRLKWIGFKNQFFSTVIIPDTHFTGAIMESAVIDKEDADYEAFLKNMKADTSMEYSSRDEHPMAFNIYLGPNLYPLLSSLDDQYSPEDDSLELTRLVSLGWALFRFINRYAVIPVFTWLGNHFTNYGLIILLLTLILKVVLFPFSYKSYISQAKMRILAPDIKAINEKYPDQADAMKRQQKTMQLYSQAGASPFGGCLPMLLQMPILIAMFTFFPSSIELRGEAFLWVKDLSAPDAILTWSGNIPVISWIFGNHLSLFCLLMTATNILYTHLNMQSQSSQQMPGMKWMMYLMPVMFLVFFNNYAAGLSYYYFVSLLITIIQTYACRLMVSEEKVRAVMAENARKPKKKSGFMARLEEAQRLQAEAQRQQKGGKGKR